MSYTTQQGPGWPRPSFKNYKHPYLFGLGLGGMVGGLCLLPFGGSLTILGLGLFFFSYPLSALIDRLT